MKTIIWIISLLVMGAAQATPIGAIQSSGEGVVSPFLGHVHYSFTSTVDENGRWLGGHFSDSTYKPGDVVYFTQAYHTPAGEVWEFSYSGGFLTVSGFDLISDAFGDVGVAGSLQVKVPNWAGVIDSNLLSSLTSSTLSIYSKATGASNFEQITNATQWIPYQSPIAIPEPSSLALALLGLTVLVMRFRQRKKQQ